MKVGVCGVSIFTEMFKTNLIIYDKYIQILRTYVRCKENKFHCQHKYKIIDQTSKYKLFRYLS
jgi:hypothetical protein